MRNSLAIMIGMTIMMGFILGSCADMKRMNLFDPGASNYEPPLELKISSTDPLDIRNWQSYDTIQFTASGGTTPYTWAIIEAIGNNPPSTISENGLFTEGLSAGTTMGYCKVEVTDSNDQKAQSGVITYDQI